MRRREVRGVARRRRESHRRLNLETGSDLILLSPRDATRYARNTQLRAAVAYPGVFLLLFGLLAVTYAQVVSGFDPALGLVGVIGTVALAAGIGAALLVTFALRVTPVDDPLTHAELDSYPGDVATTIRVGLAGLMPGGIGPGEYRPLAVARNRGLRRKYENGWDSVEIARVQYRDAACPPGDRIPGLNRDQGEQRRLQVNPGTPTISED